MIHHAGRRRGSSVAARGARAAGGDAGDRISPWGTSRRASATSAMHAATNGGWLTFHAPNLTVEHGSQRQQVAVSWYSPYSPIIRPHLHCPTCDRGCYALYEVGGIFTCRICGQLDYACRHINRHTP